MLKILYLNKFIEIEIIKVQDKNREIIVKDHLVQVYQQPYQQVREGHLIKTQLGN